MLKTVTEVCVVGPKQAYIDGDCRISHFLWQTVAYPGYGNPPPPLLKKKKKVFANNRFEYVVFSMLVWLLITQIFLSFFLFFFGGGGGGVVPTNKYKPASLIINLMIKSITKYSCHKTT